MGRSKSAQVVEDASRITPSDPEAIKALRSENATLRKRLASHGAQAELVMDAVERALADYAPPRIPPWTPPKSRRRRTEEEIVVAHLSDTQIGKVTKTYDTEIACGRIKEFGEKVCTIIDRHRAYSRVEEVHLYLGGDMVEGELIFPGQAHLIDQAVFDQSMKAGPDAVVALVMRLLRVVKKVRVVCVCGNHGRPASKHAGSHWRSNWDRVFYETVEILLLGRGDRRHKDTLGRVEFINSDDFYAINDVLGHKHLIVHGDQIRGGHGGYPWYGTGKKAWGWVDAIDEEWQTLYYGHFHTYTSGTMSKKRTWHCNGTTESDNTYAQEQLAASGRPMQRLQLWNREHGMVADRPVYLTYGL